MSEGGDYRDLTVIIPTLNEEEAIGDVIDEILSIGIPKGNIIVVDGHSIDRTVEIARSKGARVVYQDGKGKADAVRKGISIADTEYILLIDGDYTYPAKYIPVLYEKIKKECLDEVIGARVYKDGSQPLIFRLGNRLLTSLFNLLFGTRLSDVLSGLYILRRNALRDMSFVSRDFGIESEIAAHIASVTGRIGEVPVEYRERKGRKKLGLRHGFQIAWQMVSLTWNYNPAFLIFMVGAALLLIPGLIMGAYVGYELLLEGVKHRYKGIISIVLSSAGIISLFLAMQSLFMKRMEFRIRRVLDIVLGRKC